MRASNRSRRAGLLLLTLLATAPAGAQGLSGRLPEGAPPAETLAAWERADGRTEEGDWAVVYELYVNPQRPGLYEVTRFRVDRLERGPDGETRRVPETEKLVWNAHPGTRDPLVCYERTGRQGWRTLGLPRWMWRRLAPGTPEYRSAMFTALRVYVLHRARLGLSPPG
jgi:hypothetical protein